MQHVSRLLSVENLTSGKADTIKLPHAVCSSIFQRALYIALHYNEYEGHRTGALIVLSSGDLKAKGLSEKSNLVGRNICEDAIEGSLREAFSLDGGILIHGKTGEILIARCDFYPSKPSFFLLAGHGTRHNKALDVAADPDVDAVCIARSQDGPLTVFSKEHLRNEEEACCFRIRHDVIDKTYEITMSHTPLVRFDEDGKQSGKLHIPPVVQARLGTLEAPVRVVAFVGQGRTGKSTLCGKTIGDESLFPSAMTTESVTQGINAAAVRHPSGGCILFLDGEGFDNPFAPSRTEVATLCILLASVIVRVEFDRFNDQQITSLARLIACGDVISTSSSSIPPSLVVVVNGSRFHDVYDDGTLERALGQSSDDQDDERMRTRQAIKSYFPERSFRSIPLNTNREFRRSVDLLRKDIIDRARMLLHADQPFNGNMFFELLKKAVESINHSGKIESEGIFDEIVRRHLRNIAGDSLTRFKTDFTVGGPYRSERSFERKDYLGQLKEKTTPANAKIAHDVQQWLERELQRHFQEFVATNREIAKETFEEAAKDIFHKFEEAYSLKKKDYVPDTTFQADTWLHDFNQRCAKFGDRDLMTQIKTNLLNDLEKHFAVFTATNKEKGRQALEKAAKDILQKFKEKYSLESEYVPEANFQTGPWLSAFVQRCAKMRDSNLSKPIQEELLKDFEKHFAVFLKVNEQKGKEVTFEDEDNERVEVGRSYERKSRMEIVISSAGTGAGGGATAGFAGGPLGVFVGGLSGAVVAGWSASRLTATIKRTVTYARRRRSVKRLRNGEKICSEWLEYDRYTEETMVEREGD